MNAFLLYVLNFVQFEERLLIFYGFNILFLTLDKADQTRLCINMAGSRKVYLGNKNRVQILSQIFLKFIPMV